MFVIGVISHSVLLSFVFHTVVLYFSEKGFELSCGRVFLLIEYNKAYFILIRMIICDENFFFFFRFGKPLVIDMGEADMFQFVATQVNNLQAGLMDKILDKSILLEEK